MLSKEKIEVYRQKLETEKKKLLQEIAASEKPESFGSDVDDFDEEKDEATEFANQVAIVQALKDRVNEIDASLNKMATGEYGLCRNCNREISEKLLDLVPESQLCENCKRTK